jgi:hypothetical protein
MKRVSLFCIMVLFGLTVNANAHFPHRPLFHHHQQIVPIVPQSIHLGTIPVSGGSISAPQPPAAPSAQKILVSQDVVDRINNTSRNLQKANDDLRDVLKKRNIDSPLTTSGSDTRDHNLPPRIRGLTLQQFLDAFK